ncbi:MAG TPA: nuclear transport factor 2 family protein [Gammaproteobacteria bacterium]|nr:nuclear transport factor 2 family protein [Gammaproteobacteria bacterium]
MLSTFAVAISLGLCACGSDAPPPETPTPADSAEIGALWDELDGMEHRRRLVEDSNDIKRLQRAYGYYLDHKLWDHLADLFVADATLEIGLDGIYRGRDRIREYFYVLGEGRHGLAAGELNEHMQLMPVVTVAPDGMSAQGRWRDIVMAGRLGEYAVWGEGPFENEYVKEDGVWKISKLHWFQTMLVAYEGGWHQNEDFNGARWVSDRLPPDEPTSFAYEPWPATFLPPFHFPNPVQGAEAVDLAAFAPDLPRSDRSLEALAREAARLERGIRAIEDENEIENLQRIYGFYIEEGLWSEAADLFADDGVFEIAGGGVYHGKDRVREYLGSLDDEGPKEGRLYDQMQLMPIVHVAPDGRTARGRWRLFAQEAKYGEFSEWGVGWYENDYVKEDGVWKIAHLRSYIRMYTPDKEGWGRTALEWPSYHAASSIAPDAPSAIDHAPYPAVPDPDFHYPNPVTGEPADDPAPPGNVPAFADAGAAASRLADLGYRVEQIEDIEQIERLQGIYGYYLARYQMDDLAGIFSDDGTIEIALRGVYAGKASVRRNLDLYPPVDLHNHMQYQPVIHLNDDGTGANMRSRALSIMGSYGQYSMWMGGIYENEFVEEDGIWKLGKDQVFNTYFVNYAEGWLDNQPRPPPGISTDNPPDAPPTVDFEMYPSAFLPPYHYVNPVTGNRVVWDAGED